MLDIDVDGLLKLEVYILVISMLYLVVDLEHPKQGVLQNHHALQKDNVYGFGMLALLLMSAIVGWYSTICSQIPYSHDRNNYVIRFVNPEQFPSPWTIGLNLVADILHIFTNEPRWLFFSVTFICVFVTLNALRMSGIAGKDTLLLYVCSNCVIYSFYLLKQAPSMAFATLSIVLLMRGKYLASAAFVLVAISFHEAACIMVPLYIMLLSTRGMISRKMSYLLMLITLVAFSGVSRWVFDFIEHWVPSLVEQTEGYRDETGAVSYSLNLATSIKGFPYYLTFMYGLYKRNSLKMKIEKYDEYMLMAGFSSVATLLSAYMYWMWRLGAYCYAVVFIFAAELYRMDEDRAISQCFWILEIGSLAFFSIRYIWLILSTGGF